MSTLTLLYPVHTLDNQLLLPAGTVLSTETLDVLISSNRTTSYQYYSLLRHGSVKNNLLHALGQPPYQAIFTDQKQIADILNFMENVQIILPALQSLDYFKKNDFYTYHHILMVFALSTLLAQDIVSDYRDLILETASGPTHDFGKICVPLNLLKKTDPITYSERKLLEHHTIAGYALLSYYHHDIRSFAARVARDHHEKKDGSGYPRGIPLEDLMVEIVAVSDIYDALVSSRPYRPVSYDNRTALEEITGMAERNEISWEVVKALVSHNRKAKPHSSECSISTEKRGAPPPGNVYGIFAEEKNNHEDD